MPFLHNGQLVVEEVVIGLHIGETIDSGNDVCSILAKAIQDNAERLFTGTVCRLGNADCTFCRSKKTRDPRGMLKHLVSSWSNRAPKLPWPRPTLRFSATEPGMQNACKPMPIDSAASAAEAQPSSEQLRTQCIRPAGVLKRNGLYNP